MIKQSLTIIPSLVLALSSTACFAASGKRDGSFVFSNPAYLSMLVSDKHKQKINIASNTLLSKYSYTDTATSRSVSGKVSPSFLEAQYIYKVNKKTAIGIKEGTSYNINTEYPMSNEFSAEDSFPTNRTLQVLTVSPEASYDLNQYVSAGIGIDFSQGTLTQINQIIFGGDHSLPFNNKLSAWSQGFHTGILIKPWIGGFFDIGYFSKITYKLKGQSVGPTSTQAHSTLSSPAAYHFSAFQAVNKHLGFALNANYTQWSVLKSFTIANSAVGGLVTEPLNYSNQWNYSGGVRFVATKKLILKAGIAYDIAPGDPKHRIPTSTEPNHYWSASIGFNYDISSAYTLGASLGHAFIPSNQINNPTSPYTGVSTNDTTSLTLNAGISL